MKTERLMQERPKPGRAGEGEWINPASPLDETSKRAIKKAARVYKRAPVVLHATKPNYKGFLAARRRARLQYMDPNAAEPILLKLKQRYRIPT